MHTCRGPGIVLVVRNTATSSRQATQSRKWNYLKPGDLGWNPNGNLLRNANGDLRTRSLMPSGTGVVGDTPGFHPGEASSTLAFRSEGDPARDHKSRNGEGRKPDGRQSHCPSPLSRLYRLVADRFPVEEVAGVRFPVRPRYTETAGLRHRRMVGVRFPSFRNADLTVRQLHTG